MSATEVAVILKGWGEDSGVCDPLHPQYDPVNNVRFFREETMANGGDRLPNLDDGDLPYEDNGFNDPRTKKTYRHPFLRNAVASGPMRIWMNQFVTQYKARQAANPSLPDPARFLFDTEAIIARPPSPNAIRILEHLANVNQNPEYWTVRLVPGTGKTLAQLYAEARLLNPQWPANILDGIDSAADHQAQTFPGIMVWWEQQMHQVADYVMDISAYQPLRAAFPNTRVGNYDHLNCDGAFERTGWMEERVPGYTTDWYPRDRSSMDPNLVDRFPRIDLHKQWGYYFFRDQPASPPANHMPVFYDGYKKSTRGQLDSPYLYGIPNAGEYSFQGYDLAKAANVYMPYYGSGVNRPIETYWETTMRVNRQTAEAVINSFGSFPCTGQPGCVPTGQRLVPWIEMPGTDATATPGGHGEDPDQANDGFRKKREARAMMSMLRAKKVTEIIPWTSKYTPGGQSQIPEIGDAWRDTHDTAERVYATRVFDWARLRGIKPTGSIDTPKKDRLEFTLRDSAGADQTVDLLARTVTEEGTGNWSQSTELQVDFSWNTNRLFLNDAGSSFTINLECSVSNPQVTGYVLMWQPGQNGQQGEWLQVRGIDRFDESEFLSSISYSFTAPADAANETSYLLANYRSRLSFTLNVANRASVMFYESGVWKTRLKFVHIISGSSDQTPPSPLFVSKYDLVQLVPSRAPLISDTFGQVATFSIADTNYDGVIDTTDLVQYTESWIESEPVADLSGDGTVTETDWDAYVEAYINH